MIVKIVILICVIAATAVIIKPEILQPIKTLLLIVRVSPFERHIEGADTILILGDSTGYGTGASKSVESIAGRIAQDFPAYSIEPNSRNTRTIGELLSVAKEVSGEYRLILLQIGGNDILQKRDVSVVEAELRQIIEVLTPHADHLVMMSTGNVGAAPRFGDEDAVYYETKTRTFRDMFMRVASETGMEYVDLFRELNDDPMAQEPDTYLAFDGLHPSSAGYALWYQELRPLLTTILD